MKNIKWKSLIITCLVCLLPILLGIALWNDLPDTMAIHFDFHNEPDNFAPKGFVVFGLPVLMAAFQIICCIANDINAHKYGGSKKFEQATKLIIPFVAVVLQIATLGYGLGWNIEIRKACAFILGVVFIITGKYMPELDYIKNKKVDSEKARKINKLVGFETVIMGVLGLITIFLPPVTTVVWIILLIPYAVIGAAYGVKVIRRG